MYLVKSLDTGEIDEYETLDQVYGACEGIDVEDGGYEFSDDQGNHYGVEWIERVEHSSFLCLKSVAGGKYKLVKQS